MEDRNLRIGVTMREVQTTGYAELRDALAQDWPRFLAQALPNVPWLPIPNLGADSVCEFVERWNLSGLILTGGDDLGNSALRDETEQALFEYFWARSLPVLGVCRGAQLIWSMCGGRLSNIEGHRVVRHEMHFSSCSRLNINMQQRNVNSYHRICLDSRSGIPAGITPFAHASDGTIEGLFLEDAPVMGIMWHPERETPYHLMDIELMRHHFGMESRKEHAY